MEQGMAESLTTVLRQTLERYVCEEVTEGDLRQINCHTPQKTNPSIHPESSRDKINKYPQPENCEVLTKFRVNQLIFGTCKYRA